MEEAFSPITEEEEEEGDMKKRTSSIGVSKPQLRNTESSFRPPSTPMTHLTLSDAVIKPDLTLHCPECDVYIEMCHLLEHRKYHHALLTLRFTPQKPPKTVTQITDRRKKLINEIRRDQKGDIEQIHKLNEAHDIVRAHTERTCEQTREFDDYKLQEFVKGTALDCSCECVLAVGICSDVNGRYKGVMEDRRVYQDHFGNDPGKTFLGLYDGHHGCFAAEVAANEMHHILLQELVRFDPKTTCTCTVNMVTDESSTDYEQNRPYTVNSERVALHYTSTNMVQSIIHTCEKNLASLEGERFREPSDLTSSFGSLMSRAMVKSYNEVDRYLSYGMDEHSRVRWSGCSALTVVVRDESGEGEEKGGENGQEKESGEEEKGTEKSAVENSNEKESSEEKSRGTTRGTGEVKKYGELHLAQSGEVRAVLSRCGRTHTLNKDHSLRNNKERNRVIKNGGKVTGQSRQDLRINGVISSTRGLGNYGDRQLKRCIRADPYTGTVAVDEFAEFLILASRGVWEIFSDEEAATIVRQLLPRNLLPPPSRCSTSLRSLLGISSSRNSSALDQTIDLDPNPDLDPDDLDPCDLDQEKPSRPNTGKTSRVSFSRDNEVFEYGPVSLSSMMGDELARDQVRRDFAREMAERLTHAAIMAGARDNITVMVLLFPGSGL